MLFRKKIVLFLIAIASFPWVNEKIFAQTYAIHLEGNQFYSRGKIVEQLNVPGPSVTYTQTDWENWREDGLRNLAFLYQEQGFFDSQFRMGWVTDTLRNNLVTGVNVGIQEGQRYEFGSVQVESGFSNAIISSRELLCQRGRPFDRSLLYQDIRVILRAFGNHGYLHAKANEEIKADTVTKKVDVIFRVAAGNALIFDSLRIENHRDGDTTGQAGITSPHFLRELLKLKPGDTLALEKTVAYERKLRSTHVFNLLRLRDSLKDTSNGRADLLFRSEERVPGSLETSLFYETQYGPGISGGFSHGNLFGILKAGEIKTTLAQRRQSVYGKYSSLLFLMTPFRFDNELLMQWTQDADSTRHLGWFEGDFDVVNDSRFSRGFGDYFRYVAGAQLRVRRLLGPEGQLRDSTLNYLNSFFVSYLDDLFRPTRGFRTSITWGNGGPVLASGEVNIFQRRHNWLEGDLAVYWPFTSGIGMAFRLEGGRFFGEGGANSERFYLGGPRNIRSYGWRKVCPETLNGECLHENQEPEYVLGSAEARLGFPSRWLDSEKWYRHLPDFQVVPFFDYGVIKNVGQTVRPEGRGRALGLGIRYSLFNLFSLRLDYARDPWRQNLSQWCLDLAQAF